MVEVAQMAVMFLVVAVVNREEALEVKKEASKEEVVIKEVTPTAKCFADQ